MFPFASPNTALKMMPLERDFPQNILAKTSLLFLPCDRVWKRCGGCKKERSEVHALSMHVLFLRRSPLASCPHEIASQKVNVGRGRERIKGKVCE